jgi:hypothetical protein
MPMQVVVPSVSWAAVLQGRGLTGLSNEAGWEELPFVPPSAAPKPRSAAAEPAPELVPLEAPAVPPPWALTEWIEAVAARLARMINADNLCMPFLLKNCTGNKAGGGITFQFPDTIWHGGVSARGDAATCTFEGSVRAVNTRICDSTRCSFFVLMFSSGVSGDENMTDLASVRAEIDRARRLVDRQRRDILALRRAGISMADAELLLARQLARLDDLIGERNRLMAAQPSPMQGRVLGGRK